MTSPLQAAVGEISVVWATSEDTGRDTCVSDWIEWIIGSVLETGLVEISDPRRAEFPTSDWVDAEEDPKSTLVLGDGSNVFTPINEHKVCKKIIDCIWKLCV